MQQPTNKNSGNILPKLLSTLGLIVLLGGAFGLAVTQERAVADWWKLRGYTPAASIVQLATQDTLTDKARHIFYVNHPTINERPAFLAACPNSSKEQTIVLGCYQSDQAGIFLLNVTDNRLDGVKQVTSAHEMLHAAYDRLSANEKKSIDAQLLDYYKNGLTDDRIKVTIEAYKKSEPDDLVNEMHSIFGTEVAQLPANLETYYKQYFNNRSQVVAFSARYESEFTSRKDQVVAADAQLKSLKSQIDSLDSDLKTKQAEITAKQAELTSQRNSNNIAAYNSGVPAYNGLITSYNSEVQQVRNLVDQYNNLVNKRNAIAVEEEQLVKSLTAQNSTINN